MSYSYNFDILDDMNFFMIFMSIWMVMAVVVLLVGVAFYVLRALSVYTIAKRRGLNKPWLAWLPIGYEWLLGSISDQFKYLTAGKIQSRRKILLSLCISSVLCTVVSAVTTATAGLGGSTMTGAVLLGKVLMSLVSIAVSITGAVFQYMCKYDLYNSCDPKNAVAYLVVGIFIPVTEPFFLMACRKKDGGMPPRKPAPQPAPEILPEPEQESEPAPEQEPDPAPESQEPPEPETEA